MSLFVDPSRESGRSPDRGTPEKMKRVDYMIILVVHLPEVSQEIVRRYVRAIPYRRRLPRELTKRFTANILALLEEIAKTQPQFFDELARDLMLRIPRSESRSRLILAEVIKSVLEDLNVFHSRRHVFAGLPDDWDVADPENETPEWRLDVMEQVGTLREALEAIDPRSAEMLHAHYIEGQSMTDIGRKVGLRKQRVSEIMAAARAALVAAMSAVRAAR